jgi:hypothetical protein
MNADDVKAMEVRRQELLVQIKRAEAALRNGLHVQGFGEAARAHLERALAHVNEAYISVNETTQIRSVNQLVDDLNRIQQVVDNARRGQSQHP